MLSLYDWKIWLKGLIHAAISGATVAISTILVAHDTFNFGDGLDKLLSVVGASSLVSIGKYLSTKPMPEDLPEN